MAPLLQIEDLKVKYRTRDGILTAIRDVSFQVNPGEIVGVVGESGCGKSTIAATVMRLLPPNGEIAGGRMLLQGRDLCALDEESMRKLRGKEISMIFQDPMTSLNPFFSVETQMMDALRAHPRRRRGRPSCAGWPLRCSAGSASPIRKSASRTTRTSSPAACGSGSWSPSR